MDEITLLKTKLEREKKAKMRIEAMVEARTRELYLAKEKAEAASAAKSDFLAHMGHEIRTPMNAIIGFTDMALETPLTEEQKDYLKTVKRSGEALLSLLNDLLDFSKIEAGALDFEEIDFDPELVAYDACDLIRPKIGSKPIELLCHIGDDIPFKVRGDPLRFRQVLVNLMGNASKFTQAGEIELSLETEEEKDERIKLHARIRDTGIGIPAASLKTIFEPFRQADGSTTRRYGGTGLGLSICKSISALMQGDVWVESQENQGSIFHFTAWVGKSEDKEIQRVIPGSLGSRKALIVDDNRANLDILTHMLQQVDMAVVALRNGEKVKTELQNAFQAGKPFDVCICDMQMPKMGGYEIAKAVRRLNPPFQDLPLIALSSLMERDAKKCKEAGFDAFLSKPIRREKLYQMLERVLGKKEKKEKHVKARNKIITQYSVREEMKHSVRILLAEDNPVNQKLAKMMLEKAGYDVVVAENGKEAVEKYVASPAGFDLILMDVQMPVMDGIAATRKIRNLSLSEPSRRKLKTRKIPIIAMTAHAMKGDREKSLEAGMDDYMTKPIKRELVFEVIEKWVFGKKVSHAFGDE